LADIVAAVAERSSGKVRDRAIFMVRMLMLLFVRVFVGGLDFGFLPASSRYFLFNSYRHVIATLFPPFSPKF
jgi:hypothetical protein